MTKVARRHELSIGGAVSGHPVGRSFTWHVYNQYSTSSFVARLAAMLASTCVMNVFILMCLEWDVNPLECEDNYSATSNNMKLVHWPLMGGLLHLLQRGRDWAGPSRCTKCNSPPFNGHCTDHRIAVLWSVALQFSF